MGCGCKKKSSKDGSKVIKSISEEQKLYQRRVAAAFKKVTNIRNIEKLKQKIKIPDHTNNISQLIIPT